MPPTVGKVAISVAFVCPSVHYVHGEQNPRGLACQNVEGRFPTLDATRIPVSRSDGQRSGLEAEPGVHAACRCNVSIVVCPEVVHLTSIY